MEIAFVLGGLFLFCTIGYVTMAVFWPELIGIQGKKAREIEAAHKGNEDNSIEDKPKILP